MLFLFTPLANMAALADLWPEKTGHAHACIGCLPYNHWWHLKQHHLSAEKQVESVSTEKQVPLTKPAHGGHSAFWNIAAGRNGRGELSLGFTQ